MDLSAVKDYAKDALVGKEGPRLVQSESGLIALGCSCCTAGLTGRADVRPEKNRPKSLSQIGRLEQEAEDDEGNADNKYGNVQALDGIALVRARARA